MAEQYADGRELGRRATDKHLAWQHHHQGYKPLRHGVITARGELVRSTAESDDRVFAHLREDDPRVTHHVDSHGGLHQDDPYAGLDPWSDAARCVSCGHHPQACQCPHDCEPAGAER